MKKSVMTKWVKALRSGKYEQGTGVLKDTDGQYCCLGVLCDISKKGYDGSESMPPEEVWNGFAGMKTESGKLGKTFETPRDVVSDQLWELNDFGLSFKQIANIIEKNYKDL